MKAHRLIQVLVTFQIIKNLNTTRKISGGHPLSDGGESLVTFYFCYNITELTADIDKKESFLFRVTRALCWENFTKVYFVKSEKSPRSYSGWICGGTLVSEIYIITSAACIEDVPYLYAIMGYRLYVPAEDLDKDPCTKEMKRKVVYTCVPKAYELDYAKIEKWSAIDIGLAKIESSIKVHSEKFATICSYTPLFINVNYDPEIEKPGLDVAIAGWGHKNIWRQPGDNTNYNAAHAMTAWTRLINKTNCVEQYSDFPQLQAIIEKYMICTNETENKPQNRLRRKKCSKTKPFCRVRLKKNRGNRKSLTLNTTSDNFYSRRQGICQNDHGMPIGGVIGKNYVLLGVASVFRVNNNSQCEGPYLFTSTACNKDFLKCILETNHRRNSICYKSPRERGFDMIHRHISWPNQLDRPIDNEEIKQRPQVPLKYFG